MKPQPKQQDSDAPAAFDFRRIDLISKPQLGTIHFLHESFIRNLSSNLSAYLRSYLSGSLISVEQLSYEEFLEGLPSPTCLLALMLHPYDRHAVLELNPSLVFRVIDLLLGGKGQGVKNFEREITDIEESILEGVFRIIARNLNETWKSMGDVEFRIAAVEKEPQLSQRVSAKEAVVAIATELRVGENSGMMNLAIPSAVLKMMSRRFERQWAAKKSAAADADRQRMLEIAKHMPVELNAQLPGLGMPLRALMELEPGDVVDLGIPVDAPAVMLLNGRPMFHGKLAASGKGRSFLVESAVEPAGAPE